MKIDFLSGKIGVAVSGGMDSMVLLHLLLAAGVKPCVINVEHGIRGESSIKDSAFVKDFCRTYGLPLYSTQVNAVEESKRLGISLELAARKLRYDYFDKLLADGKVDRIALAHHADDNAETILMRIFRGTGIRGLKGISDRDGYVRPLIKFTRAEIEEYARKNNVPFVEDETNSDTVYTRNFIRHEILPKIKERYPEVLNSFTRLAENAAEADEFISSLTVPAEKTAVGTVLIGIFSRPELIQKYSINAALNGMGVKQDIEYKHLNSLLELKYKDNNSSVDLPFGITAVKQYDDLHFFAKNDEIFIERKFDENDVFSYKGFVYGFRVSDGIIAGITVDADKVKNCVIRPRRDGDIFHRVNGKNKLLSDFLNDKKLTKAEKDGILVLAESKVVFAILGLEVAEQAKVDKSTQKILHVTKEKNYL